MPEPNIRGESWAAKAALRDHTLAARRRRGLASIGADAAAIAEMAQLDPHVRDAATVAAYVSVGSEPGTGPLLDALAAAGKRVLLPILLPDNDLDWSAYQPLAAGSGLISGRRGLLEPTGPRISPEAIASAEVVLVPGLAADGAGHRLGRGGGSYDRALARVGRQTWVAVVLFDEEILDQVPTEPHDQRVDAAITPTRAISFD